MILEPIPLPRKTFDPNSRTLVMGIINTTPDSFADGGKHLDAEVAIEAAVEMLRAGAEIVDVGGESTRPGSLPVDPEEELRRAIPVIREVSRRVPDAVISIDTRRRVVAEAAVEAGAQIINDIAGFRDDPGLAELAREAATGVIVMHMLGRPKTMQQRIHYHSFPRDIHDFFEERINALEQAGIQREKIIIDPGIGFGKTFDQNLILINRLDYFQDLGRPICLGASRKAFIGEILEKPDPATRDLGSMAVATAGVLRGAAIVRVHDVPAAVQACKVADAIIRETVAR
jgi:dihydropteroate synthase